MERCLAVSFPHCQPQFLDMTVMDLRFEGPAFLVGGAMQIRIDSYQCLQKGVGQLGGGGTVGLPMGAFVPIERPLARSAIPNLPDPK